MIIKQHRWLQAAMSIAATAGLAACATSPVPNEKIAVAQSLGAACRTGGRAAVGARGNEIGTG